MTVIGTDEQRPLVFTLREITGLRNASEIEMAKNVGSGSASNSVVKNLHGGLKNRSPKWPDASTKPNNPMGGSVKGIDGAVRETTASTPKSLGPRTA